MTPLPPPLGSGELVFWRLDRERHAPVWDSGEGSWRAGGRWSPRGVRTVYASLDPATAILEVAVHNTFEALDVVPHVLTRARVVDPARVHVVNAADVPDADWLRPGTPGAGQQAFGAERLDAHVFVLVPSVVSNHSWNLIFDPGKAGGLYDEVRQEDFVLDPRLHPSKGA
jgi:RES domain-containing protein